MADETKYTFEYNDAAVSVEKIEAGITRMTGATEKATQSISSFAESLGTIRATLEQLQDMDLIPDKSVSNMNKVTDNSGKLYKQFKDSHRNLSDINTALNKMLTLMGRQTSELDKQSKKHDEINKKMTGPFKGARRWAKTMGEDPWEGLSQAVAKANSMQRAVTGIDVSIGGIIALLVEAYNEGRKISALATQAAGRIGGTDKAIGLTTNAMRDLRSTFRMSNDEAGEMVTTLTEMGFHSSKLANKSVFGKAGDIEKANAELGKAQRVYSNMLLDEEKLLQEEKDRNKERTVGAVIDKNAKEAMRLAKNINRENTVDIVKRDKEAFYSSKQTLKLQEDIRQKESEINKLQNERSVYSIQEVGIQTELAAIQYKYGISTQKSGGFIKQLQMEYGQTEDAARGMLGSVLKGAEELQAHMGEAIGISEVLSDYEQLIQYNKVYRTDLHSVLGLYNTLVKSSMALVDNESTMVGLRGMSKSIAVDMARGLMSAPMKMGLGWKAKFGAGLGEGAAGRAIGFEKLFTKEGMGKGGLGEAFKRIMGGVSEMTAGAGSKETKEIKTRELLSNLGIFNEETVRDLADRMAAGKLTKEDFEKIAGAMLTEQREAKEGETTWRKGRHELVNYAKIIATGKQPMSALIKSWIIDNLIGPVNKMVAFLETIAAWAGSTSASAAVAQRQLGEAGSALGVKDIGSAAKGSRELITDPAVMRSSIKKSLPGLIIKDTAALDAAMTELADQMSSNDFASKLTLNLKNRGVTGVSVSDVTKAVEAGRAQSAANLLEEATAFIDKSKDKYEAAAYKSMIRDAFNSSNESLKHAIMSDLYHVVKLGGSLTRLTVTDQKFHPQSIAKGVAKLTEDQPQSHPGVVR